MKRVNFKKIFVCSFIILFKYVYTYDYCDLMSKDTSCLKDFSIDQLLKLKKNLNDFTYATQRLKSEPSDESIESRSFDEKDSFKIKSVQPLHNLIKRNFHNHESWNDKPTKFQKVFNASITALSFLAFGGYLLCLIVQAIKSKGTTYYHPALSSNESGTTLRKVKIVHRVKRSRKDYLKTAKPTPDELYQVLISLAEGYVKISFP